MDPENALPAPKPGFFETLKSKLFGSKKSESTSPAIAEIPQANVSTEQTAKESIPEAEKPSITENPAEQPKLSRAERRALKQKAYDSRKSEEESIAISLKSTTPTPLEKPKPLAYEEATGKIEISPSDEILELTPLELHWISLPEKVKLELVSIDGGRIEFYFSDFIRGKSLTKAAETVKKTGRINGINNRLFKRIEGLMQVGGGRIWARELQSPRSPRNILKLGNSDNERSYIIRFNDIDGKRVYIRVALCDDVTSENNLVMPIIASRRKKN